MSKVYVCMAQGLEEVECLAVVDILKRGGVEVELVSMGEELLVTGSHNIRIQADSFWSKDACDACDAIFLPGGMPGTAHLSEHKELGEMICKFHREGKASGGNLCGTECSWKISLPGREKGHLLSRLGG